MEHEPAVPGWVAGLEASGLGEAMRSSALLYPAANVVHVIAVMLLVGPIIALDLRLIGIARQIDAAALDRYLTRFAYLALPVIAVTGFALFSADARALAGNQAFQVKLMLVALGLLNAVAFRLLWRHRLALWDAATPALGKAQAVASVGLWVAAVAGGRLIAYL
jgi:hypothetical protein